MLLGGGRADLGKTWGSRALVWGDDGAVSGAPQCFLNAVLQCLSSTRPLRDFCLRRDFRQEVPGGGRAQELTEGGATTPFPMSSFPQPSDLVVVRLSHGVPTLRAPLTCLFCA